MKIGVKGISYSVTERKYLVRVFRNSKTIYLGRFSSLEEAKQALEQEENKENSPEELPILASLRAEFSPKNGKKSKKVKSTFITNSTKEPTKTTSKVTHKPQKTKKPKVLSKVLKEEDLIVKSDWQISGPSEADYRRSSANQVLELILTRLLEMADERNTSVFDVIVQEIAKLSKK